MVYVREMEGNYDSRAKSKGVYLYDSTSHRV